MTPLTLLERKTASELLDLAADEYSNHSCNDFELPNTNGAWAMYMAMEDYFKTRKEDRRQRPDKSQKTFVVPDWLLMHYLAARTKEAL